MFRPIHDSPAEYQATLFDDYVSLASEQCIPTQSLFDDDEVIFERVEQGSPDIAFVKTEEPAKKKRKTTVHEDDISTQELLCGEVIRETPPIGVLVDDNGVAIYDDHDELGAPCDPMGGNDGPAGLAAVPAAPPSVPQKGTKEKNAGQVAQFNCAKAWSCAFFPQDQTLEGVEAEGDRWFEKLKPRCEKIAMQVEKCPTTGKLHLQLAILAKNKLRPTVFQLPMVGGRWEVSREDWGTNLSYCTKDESNAGKRWLHGCQQKRPIMVLQENQIQPWMRDCMAIMDQPCMDFRTVHWVWDTVGKKGKSAFAKLCVVTRPGVMVANGKNSDILAQLVAFQQTTGDWPRIVIMNLPRCTDGHVSYTSLEQIKDGLAMSGKYEGGQIIMNSPHVFVFANIEPDYTKMSVDRFSVTNIDHAPSI